MTNCAQLRSVAARAWPGRDGTHGQAACAALHRRPCWPLQPCPFLHFPSPSVTPLRCAAAAPQHYNSSTLSSCCWPLPLDCTRPGVNIRLQQNLHSNGLGLNLTKIHSSYEMVLRLRYCVSQWHSVTVDATVEGGCIYKVDRCSGAQPSQHQAPCLLIVGKAGSV